MVPKERVIIIVLLIILIITFSNPAVGQTPVKGTPQARALEFKSLLSSLEGVPHEPPRVFRTGKGYLRFVGAPPSTYFTVEPSKGGTPEQAADVFLGKWRNLFVNESPAVNFQKIRVKTQNGRSYVRYKQMYSGLEVFAAEMIVQVNATGGIDAVISDIMRDTGALDTKKISLEPRLNALTAQEKGIQFLSEQYEKHKFEASEPALMIYAPDVVGNSGEPQLVWQMEVRNVGEPLVKENVFIDAHSGEIAFHYSLVCNVMTRRIYNYVSGFWYDEQTEWPTGITDVDLAYDYLGDFYDFYMGEHGRDSYDNNGGWLVAYVRYPPFPYHLQWYDTALVIEEGYVADDVVGHEFTHLVTRYESQLITNSGESGAIAEAFCDMWGEWIDQTNGDGNDAPDVKWRLAEDWPQPYGPVRGMKNPPDYNCSEWYVSCNTQHPDYYKRPGYWYDGEDGDHFAHHNNGVGNKLCYLLTDGDTFRGYVVTGMGIEKTADLFYECQTNWGITAQDYYGLTYVLTQAAINIELPWIECENVKEACRAVGILASGEIIYVDKDANGFNNGTSWDDAYTDLQEGIIAAGCSGVNAVWVAGGTYKPVKDTNVPNYGDKSFELPGGIALIGHFGGVGTYETCANQRNFDDVNNTTILDGQIGDYGEVKYIITAEDINNAIVDGFTIEGSYSAGIFLDDANVSIVNCKLKENSNCGLYISYNSFSDIHNCLFVGNSGYGINCYSSRLVITNSTFDGNNITPSAIHDSWSDIELTDCIVKNHANYSIHTYNTDIKIEDCCIKDNTLYIYCYDSNTFINHSIIERNNDIGLACVSYSTLNLTNSLIRFNGSCGIYLQDISSATIKNNWIHNNAGAYGYGIYLTGQSGQSLIRNNSIVYNPLYGIYSESATVPNISNCIFYGNGIDDLSWEGTVYYCCLQSINSGTGNIYADPCFMNPDDPNDLHIDEDSPCIDEGNPYVDYGDETDIDGEDRVKYGRVDIGGDEYYWSPADFNNPDSRDGLVNFIDYAIFANAWDSNYSESNWNPDCNIGTPINNQIDYADLAVFCEDWLWQAGWTKTFTCGAGQDTGQAMMAGFAPAEAPYPFVSAEHQVEKAEPLKIEQMIKWLEELWLDEEVQKLIDEDMLLKFIESLKEEL